MNGIVDIFRVSAGRFLKLPKVADLVSTLAFLWASKTFVRSISPNGEMAETKMSARTNMSNTCSVVSENGRNPSLNRFPMLRSNKSPFVFLGTNNPSDARATGLKWTYRQRGSTWKRVLGYEKPAKTINFSGFIYLDCQFPRPFLLRC